jgi:hypothetical protein
MERTSVFKNICGLCGMGENSKQSVDSYVATISALWQAKKKLASATIL